MNEGARYTWCPSCAGKVLIPLHPAAPPSQVVDVRAITDAVIRDLLSWLTRNAQDPERIGRRVQQLIHAMQTGERRETLRTLAARHGISSASASEQVAEAERLLFNLRKPNSVFPHAQPPLNSLHSETKTTVKNI